MAMRHRPNPIYRCGRLIGWTPAGMRNHPLMPLALPPCSALIVIVFAHSLFGLMSAVVEWLEYKPLSSFQTPVVYSTVMR